MTMFRQCFILNAAKYAHARITGLVTRVLHFQGEDMAHKTATRAKSEPIVTVDDIDEALTHTSRSLNRDEHWQRWTDALLDQRLRLAKPSREIRVIPINETRGQH